MYRVRPLFVLVTLITGLALGASGGTPALGAGCTGIPLLPADNIAARINADLGTAATTFCLAAGTYNVAATIQLGPGDKLIGPTGAITTRGPASYGAPTARIHGSSGLQPVIRLTANNTTISWLDISGGRVGIGAAKAGNGSVIEYSAIHDTAQAGIGAMSGSLMHSQLFNNSTDKTTWGDTAGAVKGTKEYQAAFNYVHDNFGNGIWCDYGCRDTGMPNGYWVHDNLVVNNGRWGIRYEYSPMVNPGVHMGNPTAPDREQPDPRQRHPDRRHLRRRIDVGRPERDLPKQHVRRRHHLRRRYKADVHNLAIRLLRLRPPHRPLERRRQLEHA